MEAPVTDTSDANVRVAVRCRPFSTTEKSNGESNCVTISKDKIVISNPNNPGDEQSFAFDIIFDQNSFQTSVWDAIGAPILSKAFDGYNGTIFAYGQTGSGKTWSMQGAPDDSELQGIIPRLNTALFERIEIEKVSRPSAQFLVTASYFEIYNEFIFDLLDSADRKKKPTAAKGGLEIKEHPVLGVYVKGLQEHVVENAVKLQKIIDQGMKSRTVASTQMNADSSRSHSVFVITVRQKDTVDESKNVFAKVNLVDLAGSERVKSTGASGATLKEGANINKSLSELGNVINALVAQAKGKKGVFVPYRNSKLTRVLQESLGGNSITAMLAALSPAGSFFEETLSTLKYANRAKAIKVNAIKNEEASQVSKLNDEIRQLKEKLEGQHSNVDTTQLEERHRKQLLDLEEAMKSTWEAKSKVSEEHQKERKRLELEQKAAAALSEATRKRNWRLLEEKGDLDLSMSHVKEISSSDPRMSRFLTDWIASLKGICLLEQNLSEHHTVVQVYRSALEKDKAELLKVTNQGAVSSPRHSGKDGSTSTHCPPFDKAALSLWRQFNDKIQATRCEVGTWMTLQNNVLDSITQLSVAIKCAVDVMQSSSGPVSNADNADSDEMLQGLYMLSRQVIEKLNKCTCILQDTRKKLANFSMMGGEMKSTLCEYEELIAEFMKEEQVIQSSPRSKGTGRAASSSGKAQEMCALVDRMRKCGRQLTFTSSTMTSPVASRDGGSSTTKQKRESPAEILSDYTVDCMEGSLIEMHGADSTRQLRKAENSRGNVMADRNTFWVLGPKDLDSVDRTTAHPFLQVNLRQEVEIVSIILQGGFSPSTILNNLKPADVTLPCGVNIANSTGDVSLTSAALGGVISWTALLKKTPPEKFLQRPPIRFLFDLFVYCAKEFPDLFPEFLRTAEWSVVSESKKSKLDFMDIMISFLSGYLEVTAPTTATSIVSGLDAELTNVLLQHLAIAIHLCKMRLSSDQSAPTAGVCESWPTTVNIAVSADGVKWTPGNSPSGKPYSTSLIDADGKVEVKLDFPNIAAKFLRLYPVDWSSSAGNSSISSDIRSSFAVRLSIRAKAVSSPSDKPPRAPDFLGSSLGLNETELGDSDRILASLTALQDMALVIIAAIAFLSEAEKVRKARKQEELRKQMESLANEKMTLELKLANEKRDAVNEKENLSDELKSALEGKHKAQSMYEQEKSLRCQFELERDVLEEEKSALQCSLQDELDQTSLLKAELLKFQAVNEKNRMLIETLRSSLVQEEEFVAQLTIQRMESKVLQEQWDSEKDDFACQIAVLTEERDAAQSSEEVLFERLGERTQDLGTLQESYVDMTDRCNDAHDEIHDLREQVQTFQAALQERNAVFSTAMSVNCLRASQDDTVKMSTSWDEGNEKPASRGKERKTRDVFPRSPVKKAFDADTSACFTTATVSSSNATPRDVTDNPYESDDQPSTRGNSDKIMLKNQPSELGELREMSNTCPEHRQDDEDMGYEDEFEDDS